MSGAGAAPAPSSDAELSLCFELDRRVILRGARERLRIPGGWVALHPELRAIWGLNVVLLAGPLPSQFGVADLITAANRWLGHLPHRSVRVEDPAAAERVAGALAARGWERRRTRFMVLDDEAPAGRLDPRARPINEDELDTLLLADFRQSPPEADASPELPELLVAAQRALRAGTPVLRFGAGVDGGLQSMCTLFLDAELGPRRAAMVEEVSTLPGYRERGLAKAVVSAAIAAARQWKADMIIVPVDAEDWPQLMYAKLGFEPVGEHSTFLRRPQNAGRARPSRPPGNARGEV